MADDGLGCLNVLFWGAIGKNFYIYTLQLNVEILEKIAYFAHQDCVFRHRFLHFYHVPCNKISVMELE